MACRRVQRPGIQCSSRLLHICSAPGRGLPRGPSLQPPDGPWQQPTNSQQTPPCALPHPSPAGAAGVKAVLPPLHLNILFAAGARRVSDVSKVRGVEEGRAAAPEFAACAGGGGDGVVGSGLLPPAPTHEVGRRHCALPAVFPPALTGAAPPPSSAAWSPRTLSPRSSWWWSFFVGGEQTPRSFRPPCSCCPCGRWRLGGLRWRPRRTCTMRLRKTRSRACRSSWTGAGIADVDHLTLTLTMSCSEPLKWLPPPTPYLTATAWAYR